MLKATSFISPSVCPLSLDPLRTIQSVPFTHYTQTLCQLVPHAKQFVFSNANQKHAPVPCATCRGHSHFLWSFFISPFGANSQSARAHTTVSHSVGLHGFLSFFPTLAQECYDKNKKKINFLFQLLKLSMVTNGVPLLTVANTLPTSLFLTAFIAHKGCFPCSTFRL